MGKPKPSETAIRLREAREAAGLSAERLSILVGGSAATIATFERGVTRELRMSTLMACADLLGVPIAWLLLGAGKMPAPKAIREHVAGQTVGVVHDPR